ncbi:MAG: hypothetical protein H6737_11850 [Alphaproteobacteria bacterium]|nr:hypothetical protein [Alphaproteobacteria bacterium]
MSTVPSLYVPWLEAALPGPIRGEPEATCDACPMCAAGQPWRFTVDVKCCGYLPSLPNYLVGRALRDGGPGAATVRARIDGKVAVSPLGVGCPPDYAAAWKTVERTTGFGTDPTLVCPHFDRGRCAIWAHREAVCTTWFCRFDRGDAGEAFWLALRSMLQTLEQGLSRWAVGELGIDPGRRPVSWGRWADDREALFVATAERVEALRWDEVRAIGGFELRVKLREVKRAFVARA